MTDPQGTPTYKGGERSLSLQRGLRGCSVHRRTRAKTAVLETEIRSAPEAGWVGEVSYQWGNIEKGKGSQGGMGWPGGSDRRGWGHGLRSQSGEGGGRTADSDAGSSFMKLGSEGAEDRV